MTTPSSPDPDNAPRVSFTLWAVLAAALLGGIYLYFRYAGAATPLLGMDPTR